MDKQQAEENLKKVREAMTAQAQVQLAGDLNGGVPINYTSLEGNNYQGVVVFKKPNMADYMRMGAIKAAFLKDAGIEDLELVDNSVKFMAHAMATLTVVATKRPDWLIKLEAITEPDVIYHVFGKYEDWEHSFRKPIQGTTAADSADSTGAQSVDAAQVSVRGDSSDRSANPSDDGRADRAGDGAPSAG